MNTEKAVERIRSFETLLSACTEDVQRFETLLEEYRSIQGRIRSLTEYYGSEEWYSDRALDEEGLLPKNLPRGVLSEDPVYDVITGNRDNAIRMLETATEILKNL